MPISHAGQQYALGNARCKERRDIKIIVVHCNRNIGDSFLFFIRFQVRQWDYRLGDMGEQSVPLSFTYSVAIIVECAYLPSPLPRARVFSITDRQIEYSRC